VPSALVNILENNHIYDAVGVWEAVIFMRGTTVWLAKVIFYLVKSSQPKRKGSRSAAVAQFSGQKPL